MTDAEIFKRNVKRLCKQKHMKMGCVDLEAGYNEKHISEMAYKGCSIKLEVIDGKQTSWEGLWWHPEYNGYSSATISLSELRKFKGNVRLYVRKNKYFNKGENKRPNYCFCLKDSKSEVFSLLEIQDEKKLCYEDGE